MPLFSVARWLLLPFVGVAGLAYLATGRALASLLLGTLAAVLSGAAALSWVRPLLVPLEALTAAARAVQRELSGDLGPSQKREESVGLARALQGMVERSRELLRQVNTLTAV